MKRVFVWMVLLVTAAGFSGVQAAPLPGEKVPQPLKPWIGWVLHGQGDTRCPVVYNDVSGKICVWPSALSLAFNAEKASFSQKWKVYQENARVMLPGSRDLWPQKVTVDGSAHPVGKENGHPYVFLEKAGKYTVKGNFEYRRIPENINVPGHTGIVDLTVKGKPVPFPRLDRQGRLWLGSGGPDAVPEEQKQADSIHIKVHRLIRDDIPARMVTRLDLKVSGSHRKETVGRAFTDRFIPLAMESPLPARIEKDGNLVLQVRPGDWTVTITTRHKGPLTSLSMADAGRLENADTEVWSFQPFDHLRMVDITGPPRVDPEQTTMPPDWRNYPAFIMEPGTEMDFSVKKRGDPNPAPDRLNLDRRLWLDFDGDGFSVIDSITGSMTTGWRLSADPQLSLGRVTVNGEPRLITRLEGEKNAGVEMRYGRVDLEARARIDDTGRIRASGWNKTFQSVKGTLHLPPGWSVFSARGIDRIRDTWVKQWTLLDIFVVLVIALAAAKLKGVRWGAAVFATLVLIKHQPGAPVWVWLHLLAAAALLKFAPEGRIRRVIRTYRLGCILFLVVVSVPFMAHQAKVGIYPQLEKPWKALPDNGRPARVSKSMTKSKVRPDQSGAREKKLSTPGFRAGKMLYGKKAEIMEQDAAEQPVKEIDPGAKIQTGPGIPTWQWERVSFSWNGPVARDRRMSFALISPPVNAALAFARIGLLLVLISGFSGVVFRKGKGLDFSRLKTGTALIVPVLLLVCTASGARAETGFPPDRLLKELKDKLTVREQPRCEPECASISKMDLTIDERSLSVRLEVHSLYESVAVPLPGSADQWLPVRVMIDGQEAGWVYRDPDSGHIWIPVTKGVHQVELSGYLPHRNTVGLALPIKPGRVTAEASGWQVEGIGENGIPENRLQLTRILKESDEKIPKETFEPERLPPFLEVTRTLHLGLDWIVRTVVRRVSPEGFSVVTSVPLLEGEAVVSDVPVENGRVGISMGPGESVFQWRSSLDMTERLELKASETPVFTEVWKVDAGPVWHAQMTGIPVIHHQDRSGTWFPQYRPWPGESLSIRITRPEGTGGATHTIEKSRLELSAGKRITRAELELNITSSRGGKHEIQLPPSSTLQSVSINGESRPIRMQGDSVSLPLTPGKQNIRLDWHETRDMGWKWTTSTVDLGMPAADSVVTAKMPENRWILFCGGPYVGPAVLFWSAVLVIVLISAGLCRIKSVPLRFHHWVLLGIGLIQASMLAIIPVAAWLLALGARKAYGEKQKDLQFNLVQIVIVGLTAAAAASLFYGIQNGLLGYPDMQIAGNGSHGHFLRWYADRAAGLLPGAFVISLPMLVYRLLILLWALWLAFSFLKWLRWGFECFGTGGFRRPVNLKVPRPRRGKKEEETL